MTAPVAPLIVRQAVAERLHEMGVPFRWTPSNSNTVSSSNADPKAAAATTAGSSSSRAPPLPGSRPVCVGAVLVHAVVARRLHMRPGSASDATSTDAEGGGGSSPQCHVVLSLQPSPQLSSSSSSSSQPSAAVHNDAFLCGAALSRTIELEVEKEEHDGFLRSTTWIGGASQLDVLLPIWEYHPTTTCTTTTNTSTVAPSRGASSPATSGIGGGSVPFYGLHCLVEQRTSSQTHHALPTTTTTTGILNYNSPPQSTASLGSAIVRESVEWIALSRPRGEIQLSFVVVPLLQDPAAQLLAQQHPHQQHQQQQRPQTALLTRPVPLSQSNFFGDRPNSAQQQQQQKLPPSPPRGVPPSSSAHHPHSAASTSFPTTSSIYSVLDTVVGTPVRDEPISVPSSGTAYARSYLPPHHATVRGGQQQQRPMTAGPIHARERQQLAAAKLAQQQYHYAASHNERQQEEQQEEEHVAVCEDDDEVDVVVEDTPQRELTLPTSLDTLLMERQQQSQPVFAQQSRYARPAPQPAAVATPRSALYSAEGNSPVRSNTTTTAAAAMRTVEFFDLHLRGVPLEMIPNDVVVATSGRQPPQSLLPLFTQIALSFAGATKHTVAVPLQCTTLTGTRRHAEWPMSTDDTTFLERSPLSNNNSKQSGNSPLSDGTSPMRAGKPVRLDVPLQVIREKKHQQQQQQQQQTLSSSTELSSSSVMPTVRIVVFVSQSATGPWLPLAEATAPLHLETEPALCQVTFATATSGKHATATESDGVAFHLEFKQQVVLREPQREGAHGRPTSAFPRRSVPNGGSSNSGTMAAPHHQPPPPASSGGEAPAASRVLYPPPPHPANDSEAIDEISIAEDIVAVYDDDGGSDDDDAYDERDEVLYRREDALPSSHATRSSNHRSAGGSAGGGGPAMTMLQQQIPTAMLNRVVARLQRLVGDHIAVGFAPVHQALDHVEHRIGQVEERIAGMMTMAPPPSYQSLYGGGATPSAGRSPTSHSFRATEGALPLPPPPPPYQTASSRGRSPDVTATEFVRGSPNSPAEPIASEPFVPTEPPSASSSSSSHFNAPPLTEPLLLCPPFTDERLRRVFLSYDTEGRQTHLTREEMIRFYKRHNSFASDESLAEIADVLRRNCRRWEQNIVSFDEFCRTALRLARA